MSGSSAAGWTRSAAIRGDETPVDHHAIELDQTQRRIAADRIHAGDVEAQPIEMT